jgi:hypothetical protein
MSDNPKHDPEYPAVNRNLDDIVSQMDPKGGDNLAALLLRSIEGISKSITYGDVSYRAPDGGNVECLTTSMIHVGNQIGRVADALEALAQAVDGKPV